MRRTLDRHPALLLLILLAALPVLGEEGVEAGGEQGAAPPPRLLIRAAEVHLGDGEVLRPGEVLLEGGKVAAVGGVIDPRTWEEGSEPEVHDLRPMVITPGLVDGWTTVPGEGGTSPAARAADVLDPYEPLVGHLRRAGVTAVCLVARGQGAGGQAALVRLGPSGPEVLEESVGLAVSLGAAAGAASSDARAASVLGLARNLSKGRTYAGKWEGYRKAKAEWDELSRRKRKKEKEPKRPRHDRDREVWARVAKADLRLLVEAHRADTVSILLDLLAEEKVPATIVGCTECGRLAGRLGESRAAVMLHPLAPPCPPERCGEPDPALAGKLSRAQAVVSASAAGPWPAGPLWTATAAAALAAGGLDAGEAVAGVTGRAAAALGVEDRVGLLRPGRSADLVVWDGPPLHPSSRVEAVLVGGEVVEGELP